MGSEGPPRLQKKKKGQFKKNLHAPVPLDPTASPKTGAWENGVPEFERLRQGEFTSPHTGQVYDRWAPMEMKQLQVDRRGGLGRARAYQTPQQRRIIEAKEEQIKRLRKQGKKMRPSDMYAPGLTPAHLVLEEKLQQLQASKGVRWAELAGAHNEIFKQLLVWLMCDIKLRSKDSPLWYVEPMGGEGEYHISRMKKSQSAARGALDLPWLSSEDVFEAMQEQRQDLDTCHPVLKAWFEAMEFINDPGLDVDVKKESEVEGIERPDMDDDEGVDKKVEEDGEDRRGPMSIEWLPSTTLLALRRLREQDPVTLIEDYAVSFAGLFNFIRNFGADFKPNVEILHRDAWKTLKWVFLKKKSPSKAHGKAGSTRGLVVFDPDYRRGGVAGTLSSYIEGLVIHWFSATVAAFYELTPDIEIHARKFIRTLQKSDRVKDFVVLEWYINEPRQGRISSWKGGGAVIINPPYGIESEFQAAVADLQKILAQTSEGADIRVVVDRPKDLSSGGQRGSGKRPKQKLF